MNPNPIATKNTKRDQAPFREVLPVVKASGRTIQTSVNPMTVTSSAPKIMTATALLWFFPLLHSSRSNSPRSRSMLKKNGLSSVGATILRGNVEATRSKFCPEAMVANVASRDILGLRTTSNRISLATPSIVSRSSFENGSLLTRIVPTPSGVTGDPAGSM